MCFERSIVSHDYSAKRCEKTLISAEESELKNVSLVINAY